MSKLNGLDLSTLAHGATAVTQYDDLLDTILF
mgnify:CR=1 FL=1|jgi:hypothetical protein